MCDTPRKDVNGCIAYMDCPAHGSRPAEVAAWCRPEKNLQYDAWPANAFAGPMGGCGLVGKHESPLLARFSVARGDRAGVSKARRQVVADLGVDAKKGAVAWCSACAWFVPARLVKPSRPVADPGEGRCGGACLNGRRECDCPCMGLCHGAGSCRCGNPSDGVARFGRVAQSVPVPAAIYTGHASGVSGASTG